RDAAPALRSSCRAPHVPHQVGIHVVLNAGNRTRRRAGVARRRDVNRRLSVYVALPDTVRMRDMTDRRPRRDATGTRNARPAVMPGTRRNQRRAGAAAVVTRPVVPLLVFPCAAALRNVHGRLRLDLGAAGGTALRPREGDWQSCRQTAWGGPLVGAHRRAFPSDRVARRGELRHHAQGTCRTTCRARASLQHRIVVALLRPSRHYVEKRPRMRANGTGRIS
ncbi:MAG: hypothetical protein FD160_3929, partial [Caulobacteraceae bacterium]